MEHLPDNPGESLREVAMILAAGILRCKDKMSAERKSTDNPCHLQPRQPLASLAISDHSSDVSDSRVNGVTNSHQGG